MFCMTGVCTNSTAPSVSSINRILRNRAAERAAAEFARNYQIAAAATAVHYQQGSASGPNVALTSPVLPTPPAPSAMLAPHASANLLAGKRLFG